MSDSLSILIGVCALGMTMVHSAGAQEPEIPYSRERYELIVERAPFATDPVVEEPVSAAKEDAAARAAAKRLEQQLRLCFLLENNDGEVRAGFQNLKARPGDPRSIILRVGESFQGMKLQEIDLPDSSATLEHLGNPVMFTLAKAPAAAQPKAPQAPQQPQRRGGFRRQPQRPEPPKEPELSPAEQARKREEVRENLRQYQMEVIRAGMPPLPIPLTQEMDDQLVNEGVLPPE